MKQLLSLMPLIILLGIISLSIWYLANRFAGFFNLSQKVFVLGFSVAILVCFFGVMFAMRANATGLAMHIFSNIVAVGLGVLIFLLGSTLWMDLLRLFVKLPALFSGISVIVCTLLFSGYALWNAQHTQVIRQKISMPHLGKPIKIMQFTDVHLGYYWGKNTLQKLVDLTLKEDVDAVVITGDLFDGRIRLSNETIEPLKHLKVPVYFVQGNHDGYTGALEIKAMLRQNGVIVLSNEVAHLGELQIVGLDYMISDDTSKDMMHVPRNGKTMQNVLPTLGIDREKPALLLHHNPTGVQYAQAAGIDLYLAGHTHSGQFYPLIWVNDRIFKYNRGLYKYKGMQIYVSQGSGTFGPPMRLGTSSEITLIMLEPAI